MVVTNDVTLPEISELTVQEVNLPTSILMAASPYIGKQCECVNNEFMLCRYESNDPRTCVDLGKKVTSCTLSLFQNIKKNCLEEFIQYANCIDKSSGDFCLSKCRNTQGIFDCCMQEKLEMERPDFGYFCRTRVHSSPTASPPAEPCPCKPKYPDKTPSLPDDAPRPPARYGGRAYWFME
ncbi:NADH dehydrogenase [ubiquinone] 1 alpha subcomplex subunit 8-like [Danaus plexippus]|uniref:NADH dehydrogenase [ubiquinone] 1 alpha subcomplex subunit 8-like n=1 Tax=Danaus plexippus TaxID=13037 RepID=UPI002AB30FC3|nr:NADH dehydrogenase [ubiquinone] 1 alpha subcomplex subunit 8-like [Danaus plexippus]